MHTQESIFEEGKAADNPEMLLKFAKTKSRKVKFGYIDVYHFGYQQGFQSIPEKGGITLGMENTHHMHEKTTLAEYIVSKSRQLTKDISEGKTCYREKKSLYKKISNIKLKTIKKRKQRIKKKEINISDSKLSMDLFHNTIISQNIEINKSLISTGNKFTNMIKLANEADKNVEMQSISDEPSNTDKPLLLSQQTCSKYQNLISSYSSVVIPPDENFIKMRISDPNLVIDNYYLDRPNLNKVTALKRRNILGRSGIICDGLEKIEVIDIRESRKICGCACIEGVCLPEFCECILSGIMCQVDLNGPCTCSELKCLNINGFMGFNFNRVKMHTEHVLRSDWSTIPEEFNQTDGGACLSCFNQLKTPNDKVIKRLATHTPLYPLDSKSKVKNSLEIKKLKSILKETPTGRKTTPNRCYEGVSCTADIINNNETRTLEKVKRHIRFSESEDESEIDLPLSNYTSASNNSKESLKLSKESFLHISPPLFDINTPACVIDNNLIQNKAMAIITKVSSTRKKKCVVTENSSSLENTIVEVFKNVNKTNTSNCNIVLFKKPTSPCRRSPRSLKKNIYSEYDLSSSEIYTDTPDKPPFRKDHNYSIKPSLFYECKNSDTFKTKLNFYEQNNTSPIRNLLNSFENTIIHQDSPTNSKLIALPQSSITLSQLPIIPSPIKSLSCNSIISSTSSNENICSHQPEVNSIPLRNCINKSPFLKSPSKSNFEDDLFTENDILVENVLLNLVDSVVKNSEKRNTKTKNKKKVIKMMTPTYMTTRAKRRSFLLKQRYLMLNDSVGK